MDRCHKFFRGRVYTIVGGSRPARLVTALGAASGYSSDAFAILAKDVAYSEMVLSVVQSGLSMGQFAYIVGKTDIESVNEAVFGYALIERKWPDMVIIEVWGGESMAADALVATAAHAKELARLSNAAVILLSKDLPSAFATSDCDEVPSAWADVAVLRPYDMDSMGSPLCT